MSKNFELLQQTSTDNDLFQTPSEAPEPARPSLVTGGPAGRVRNESRPTQSKAFPEKVSARNSIPGRWLETIRGEVKNLQRQVQTRRAYSQADEGAITREEGIKLVQRIFSSGRNSPQAVVFCGVEGEAESGAICGRSSEILAAQAEAPVCVVDANFRSPSLHRYFGVDNSRGLAEAISEPGPVRDFVQHIPDSTLWVMPSGLATAQIRFARAAGLLQARLTELRAEFRHVVIHASPLNGDMDSILLSRWTDGVVLVVEANSTRREIARRVKENLQVGNVRLLGVVLSNRTFPIPEALYRRL